MLELKKDSGGHLLPFETKGGRYIPLKYGSKMGLHRYEEYSKLSTVLGMNLTFVGMRDAFKEIQKMALADIPYEEARLNIVLYCDGIHKRISEVGSGRHMMASYMATVFMYKEGTDPIQWSYEAASDWIADWKESGVDEDEIFFFAKNRVNGLNEELKARREEQEREAERLSGILTT